jgi:hypothetical protein
MPRPPYFGEKTEDVVDCLRKISEHHRQNNIAISLTYLANTIRSKISGIPPDPKRRRRNKRTGKMERVPDPLRHIIFKLAKKNNIWFGKPV